MPCPVMSRLAKAQTPRIVILVLRSFPQKCCGVLSCSCLSVTWRYVGAVQTFAGPRWLQLCLPASGFGRDNKNRRAHSMNDVRWDGGRSVSPAHPARQGTSRMKSLQTAPMRSSSGQDLIEVSCLLCSSVQGTPHPIICMLTCVLIWPHKHARGLLHPWSSDSSAPH